MWEDDSQGGWVRTPMTWAHGWMVGGTHTRPATTNDAPVLTWMAAHTDTARWIGWVGGIEGTGARVNSMGDGAMQALFPHPQSLMLAHLLLRPHMARIVHTVGLHYAKSVPTWTPR